MPMPPNAGPNVILLMQRLDLIEKKIDWIAGRVASLTYADGAPAHDRGRHSVGSRLEGRRAHQSRR